MKRAAAAEAAAAEAEAAAARSRDRRDQRDQRDQRKRRRKESSPSASPDAHESSPFAPPLYSPYASSPTRHVDGPGRVITGHAAEGSRGKDGEADRVDAGAGASEGAGAIANSPGAPAPSRAPQLASSLLEFCLEFLMLDPEVRVADLEGIDFEGDGGDALMLTLTKFFNQVRTRVAALHGVGTNDVTASAVVGRLRQ